MTTPQYMFPQLGDVSREEESRLKLQQECEIKQQQIQRIKDEPSRDAFIAITETSTPTEGLEEPNLNSRELAESIKKEDALEQLKKDYDSLKLKQANLQQEQNQKYRSLFQPFFEKIGFPFISDENFHVFLMAVADYPARQGLVKKGREFLESRLAAIFFGQKKENMAVEKLLSNNILTEIFKKFCSDYKLPAPSQYTSNESGSAEATLAIFGAIAEAYSDTKRRRANDLINGLWQTYAKSNITSQTIQVSTAIHPPSHQALRRFLSPNSYLLRRLVMVLLVKHGSNQQKIKQHHGLFRR